MRAHFIVLTKSHYKKVLVDLLASVIVLNS